MTKNIIFDCSDTLLRLGSIDYLEELVGDRAYAEDIHYRIFGSPAWHDYDCGKIDDDSLEAEILPLLTEQEQTIGKTYLENWMNHYTIIDGIPELLQELKDKGYKLFLLSDFPPSFEKLWNSYDFFKLFDGRVISYEVGLRKRDGGLFEYLLQKYGLKAEECVFTDDVPAIIEAGKKAGIPAFVFTDVPNLRKDLGL